MAQAGHAVKSGYEKSGDSPYGSIQNRKDIDTQEPVSCRFFVGKSNFQKALAMCPVNLFLDVSSKDNTREHSSVSQVMHGLRFQTVQWAFPFAVTLHNVEEAMWLPRLWVERSWHIPINSAQFRVAATFVAIAAYFLTYVSIRRGRKSMATYAWAGFVGITLLNAVWHVASSAYLRTFAPGVITAVLLVMPVTIYLLQRGFREQYI